MHCPFACDRGGVIMRCPLRLRQGKDSHASSPFACDVGGIGMRRPLPLSQGEG